MSQITNSKLFSWDSQFAAGAIFFSKNGPSLHYLEIKITWSTVNVGLNNDHSKKLYCFSFFPSSLSDLFARVISLGDRIFISFSKLRFVWLDGPALKLVCRKENPLFYKNGQCILFNCAIIQCDLCGMRLYIYFFLPGGARDPKDPPRPPQTHPFELLSSCWFQWYIILFCSSTRSRVMIIW